MEANAERPILLVGVKTDGAIQLGKVINAFRRQNELTPTQLAEKVDVHVSYIRGIERGAQSPSIRTAKRIFDCLPSDNLEVVWVDDPLVDLILKQQGTELWFRFSSEVAGQNKRGGGSLPIYVAMRLPEHDGSGALKLLGVYDDRRYAEARCFRDRDNGPVDVFDCVLNVDLEE